MNRNLTISAIVAGIFLAASALTFQIVSASSGSEDVFKSWRSLIPSLLDLQHRVLELEEKTEVLEERVLELEEELNENTPPLIGNFFLVEGQEYGPGDEVFIQGFLQEVVAGKDTVHIEVKAFDGTAIESEDVDLDGNNFEFFFELPYLLNDGLYTVKLEYDSWTAFSYFIVDKQQDSITVQTENMTYDLGDDIVVTGMISSILSEQYTAELQVMDPNNDEIVNEQVDLEGDEFFEFAFDLANDGSLGRYAVIASYANGDQLGFALFEVKD